MFVDGMAQAIPFSVISIVLSPITHTIATLYEPIHISASVRSGYTKRRVRELEKEKYPEKLKRQVSVLK